MFSAASLVSKIGLRSPMGPRLFQVNRKCVSNWNDSTIYWETYAHALTRLSLAQTKKYSLGTHTHKTNHFSILLKTQKKVHCSPTQNTRLVFILIPYAKWIFLWFPFLRAQNLRYVCNIRPQITLITVAKKKRINMEVVINEGKLIFLFTYVVMVFQRDRNKKTTALTRCEYNKHTSTFLSLIRSLSSLSAHLISLLIFIY